MGYAEVYKSWQDDPEVFWMEQAKAISWDKPPSKALHAENAPLYEWYKDAQVNACYNAVDRHVEAGRGDQTAIIYDSPITGNKSKTSFAELQVQTASLAGALQAKGIVAGDRVIIYMPMVTEALVAMLACARIGAVHSVVFGGFAAHELAVRIDDATPKAIIAASCGLEPNRIVAYKPLIDGAIEQSKHKPDFTIVLQREQHTCDMIEGRDFDWHDVQKGVAPAPCIPVSGDHPAYILYTSGTTGCAQGRRASNSGSPRGAELDDEIHLQREPRRSLLGRIRRGLGRGAFLHLLRSFDRRHHHGRVRGQADWHA